MAPSKLQHRRTHNLLLISKLLSQRDNASPFTLVVDSLEQSGRPLIAEYLKKARASKIHVIFVSFETLRKPQDVTLVPAWQNLQNWQKEVMTLLKTEPTQRKLLVFDALNPLATIEPGTLPSLLSSFFGPSTSLLAVYHGDVPTASPSTSNIDYSPTPLVLLRFLATTVFEMHSLHHVLAQKKARERSHAEPSFGFGEGVEGVIQGMGANGIDGVVLEMEHRRRSGRSVREWYFLPPEEKATPSTRTTSYKLGESVVLLEDHPLYRSKDENASIESEAESETTFDLRLTDKQKRDREGVVLPYFDAQKGGGEGGRILYDMDREDDFDEEEDEI